MINRWVDDLLRLPLFYKIVIANVAVVSVVALGALSVSQSDGITRLAIGGVAASAMINAALVRLALRPVRGLEETAERVQSGDLGARAPQSRLADRNIDELIRAFNGALESLQEYRDQLRAMGVRSTEAEERDREQISRELYDDRAQRLAALLVRLRSSVGEQAEEVITLCDEVRNEIAGALEVIRKYAREQRPPELDDLGVVAATSALGRTRSEPEGPAIVVVGSEIEPRLIPEIELALYRVIQEAIENAIRHANASDIRVSIARQDDRIHAEIVDDGHGFSVDEALGSQDLGLFAMRERAISVGGTLTVKSTRTEGTRVQVEVPYHPRDPQSSP